MPNTASIYFDGIEGEALVIALDLKGLAVSTGAACSSGAIEPSHVLTAMGLRPDRATLRNEQKESALQVRERVIRIELDRARASIRFSLGKQNTAEDVDFALGLIPDTVARLRALSPVFHRVEV